MDLLAELEKTRGELDAYYQLPSHDLSKTYLEGKWTVREILVHMADAEAVLQERIKRIIAEPGRKIWAFDQDRWAVSLDYQRYPLELSRVMFNANRQSLIYLASQFYHSHGSLEFEHSEMGKRTLEQEFAKVLHHAEGHLMQIRLALKI